MLASLVLKILSSSDPPASASQVVGTTSAVYHSWLRLPCFPELVLNGIPIYSHSLCGQAALELLT